MMKDPAAFSRGRFIYVLIIASVASIYAIWTLMGVGKDVVFYGCLFFFSIFWFHVIYKWYQWAFQFRLNSQDELK